MHVEGSARQRAHREQIGDGDGRDAERPELRAAGEQRQRPGGGRDEDRLREQQHLGAPKVRQRGGEQPDGREVVAQEVHVAQHARGEARTVRDQPRGVHEDAEVPRPRTKALVPRDAPGAVDHHGDEGGHGPGQQVHTPASLTIWWRRRDHGRRASVSVDGEACEQRGPQSDGSDRCHRRRAAGNPRDQRGGANRAHGRSRPAW